MVENYSSYRIRTEVGQDAPNVINVKLDQTYDEFQILSLKIDQKNSYNLYQSDKGIVVGRVLANGGVGIANAKISIFIEADENTPLDERVLYPYESVNDTNGDRVRYNLLPDYVDETCHQNIGTFPNKRLVLDNDDVIEVFDKFWKYTTVTNSSGDYMLYGIPTGNHTLHMDVDLSDIGFLSQRPRDLSYKGYNINLFESPNKFKQDTNLNSLAQVKSQDIGVYVYPFWGDTTDNGDNIAVTRCDIQVDYKFEPTCIFMGSIITDTGSNAIGKNCTGTDEVGKMSDLVAGEGSIEMIRKTIDNKVEEFQVKGNRVIDGNGVWCYQIPMNLDYVMTDEFGNLVPTDNPDKGIPTRTRVRFRISLDSTPNDNTARKRCSYLVPNNPRFDEERFPIFTTDAESHDADYEFGTNTRDESYCDLFWNKVYTVKNYIPRLQKNNKITNREHTGIKLISHFGDNNPMPFNNLSVKLPFLYRFICVLVKIFIMLVGFLNNIISIIGALPCQLAKFFRAIASIFVWPIKFLGYPFRAAAAVFDLLTPPCVAISSEFCSDDVTHPYTFYPGCGQKGLAYILGPLAECVWQKTRDDHFDDMQKVPQEDRTYPTNNEGELENCVESQLANDNDVTSFNFHNDWINGTLYAPLWFRKITPKKSFFFGLFKRKAKDEWCSSEQTYNGLLRLFQPCSVKRTGSRSYTNHEGANKQASFMSTSPGCDEDCQDYKFSYGLNNGLILAKQTMLGETVYYYKAIELEKNPANGYNREHRIDDETEATIKLLFATDIVLLGSLNDCDLNGVPQFFKSLEPTTYKLPQNMLFTDNTMIQKFNEDGTLSTEYDLISASEMTGNDWGNSNSDMCGEPDTGLFYSVGCSTIEMRPKSCINLIRLCEFGVSLDEAKNIPTTISAVESAGDSAFETLRPDGFVSKDELYNDDERSMFATMNGNELRTKLNTENGLKEYDFRHLYVDNFDNSLYNVMRARQRKCSDFSYGENYNLEDFSPGYYDFRMGKEPFYYDTANRFPRYENSFYFYFGLKSGKTAIEKFNSEFFAECYNPEEAVSPIGIETVGNTWCSEADSKDVYNKKNDGYVKIDLSNIDLPCDIIINDNNSHFQMYFEGVDDENIIIANDWVADRYPDWEQMCMVGDGSKYVLKYDVEETCDLEYEIDEETYDNLDYEERVKYEEASICSLDNSNYTMVVTDNSGEIISLDFDLLSEYLKYDMFDTNFKFPENVLFTTERFMQPINYYEYNGSEPNIASPINEIKYNRLPQSEKANWQLEGEHNPNTVDMIDRISIDTMGYSLDNTSKYYGTRTIGGTIFINSLMDGLTGGNLESYNISIVSTSKIEDWKDKKGNDSKFETNIEVRYYDYDNDGKNNEWVVENPCDFWINKPSKPDEKGNVKSSIPLSFIIGVPRGEIRYRVTVTQYCCVMECVDGEMKCVYKPTNNKFTQTVFVGDLVPYKLYFNNVVDYDVISHWNSGFKLKDINDKSGTAAKIQLFTGTGPKLADNTTTIYDNNTAFNKNVFNPNWLHISDYDGMDALDKTKYRYQWDKLISYQKALKALNKALEEGVHAGEYEEARYRLYIYYAKPDVTGVESPITTDRYNRLTDDEKTNYEKTRTEIVLTEENYENLSEEQQKEYYRSSEIKLYHYEVQERETYWVAPIYTGSDGYVEESVENGEGKMGGYYDERDVEEGSLEFYGFPLTVRDDKLVGFDKCIYKLSDSGLLSIKTLSDNKTKVPYIEGILTNDILNDHKGYIAKGQKDSLINFMLKLKNTLESGEHRDNIQARDILATVDAVTDACNKILEIKVDFINEMKNVFWLTCPDDDKKINFKAVTENMPVAYYIAHRSERAADEGTGNTLEYSTSKKELTYSFNDGRRIDSIMIPSITHSDSERFGLTTIYEANAKDRYYIDRGSGVTLGIDNTSKFPDKQKYGFFVGVINSTEQRDNKLNRDEPIPFGETIPDGIKYNSARSLTSKLFGFHVVDKLLETELISWAAMVDMPYFDPKTDKDEPDLTRVGRTVNMCGLLAGKINNGVVSELKVNENDVNYENGEAIPLDYNDDNKDILIKSAIFETQTVGRFKMEIATPKYKINNFAVTSKEIGDSAFRDSTSILSVTIPNIIEKIRRNAFNGCINLESITIESTTPPVLGNGENGELNNGVFDNTGDCQIKVPISAVNTYKGSNTWQNYRDRIIGDEKIVPTAVISGDGGSYNVAQYVKTTLLNEEDALPTRRFISGSQDADGDYFNWKYYLVDSTNIYDHTKSAGGKKAQYMPLLPVTSTMAITDESYCNLTKEIYGGMSITLGEKAVNNCNDMEDSVLQVTISGGPTDGVVYFGYRVYPDNEDGKKNMFPYYRCDHNNTLPRNNYPINFISPKRNESGFNEMEKEYREINDDQKVFINCNRDGWKIFGPNVGIWPLTFSATKYLTGVCRDDAGEQVYDKCAFLGINCDFDGEGDNDDRVEDYLDSMAISSTGYFQSDWGDSNLVGAYYVVAKTKDNCRVISPAYQFVRVYGSAEYGALYSKQYLSEDEKDENGNVIRAKGWYHTQSWVACMFIYNTVKGDHEKVTDETDFGEDNLKKVEDLYYFNYYEYELQCMCKVNGTTYQETAVIQPQCRLIPKLNENKYVNKNDGTIIIKEEYNALPDENKIVYKPDFSYDKEGNIVFERDRMRFINGVWIEFNSDDLGEEGRPKDYTRFQDEAHDTDLEDIISITAIDVTGLKHKTFITEGVEYDDDEEVIDFKNHNFNIDTRHHHQWNNVTCSLNGGYWPNYKDYTDYSDTETRTQNLEIPVGRQSRTPGFNQWQNVGIEQYTLKEIFGEEPKREDKITHSTYGYTKKSYIFKCWYEEEDIKNAQDPTTDFILDEKCAYRHDGGKYNQGKINNNTPMYFTAYWHETDWNGITCKLDGGYWKNTEDETDHNDIKDRTKYVIVGTEYRISDLFPIPFREDKTFYDDYGFIKYIGEYEFNDNWFDTYGTSVSHETRVSGGDNKINNPKTLKADWKEKKKYYVNCDPNGGYWEKSNAQDHSDTYTKDKIIRRDGYGAVNYKIEIEFGTVARDDFQTKDIYGNDVTIKYTFNGWQVLNSEQERKINGSETISNESLYLIAIWEENTQG